MTLEKALSTGGTALEPQAQQSDEDLLLGYRESGDSQFLNALVYRYEGELYSFLRHYLGDDQNAEEAFHMTWLEVNNSASKFQPDQDFRTWLYSIAMKVAHGYPQISPIQDDTPAPQSIKEAQDRSVNQAVWELDKLQNQVFLLVFNQKLRFRQVAEALNVSEKDVREQFAEAFRNVREKCAGVLQIDGGLSGKAA